MRSSSLIPSTLLLFASACAVAGEGDPILSAPGSSKSDGIGVDSWEVHRAGESQIELLGSGEPIRINIDMRLEDTNGDGKLEVIIESVDGNITVSETGEVLVNTMSSEGQEALRGQLEHAADDFTTHAESGKFDESGSTSRETACSGAFGLTMGACATSFLNPYSAGGCVLGLALILVDQLSTEYCADVYEDLAMF